MSEPLISVDLGPNGGLVKLYSPSEIHSWAFRERDFWLYLQDAYREFRPVYVQQISPINKILEICPSNTERLEEDRQKTIESIISENYLTSKILHSQNTKAIFINEHRRDPQASIIILSYFIYPQFDYFAFLQRHPADAQKLLSSLVEATLFDKGLHGSLTPERNSLADLKKEYSNIFESLRNEAINSNQQSQQELTEGKTAFSKVISEAADLTQQKKTDFDALHKSADDKIKELIDVYYKKLQLQASDSYWSRKAKRHRLLSLAFAAIFIVSLLVFGYGMFCEINYLFATSNTTKTSIEAKASPSPQIPQTSSKPEYWVLSILALSTLIGIWFIRIIVRVLLSNIHLYSDASERVTMLTTYLALIQEGKGICEDDRQLILMALFRPSSSGLIKDDALPSSFWEMMTRVSPSK